MPLWLLLLHFQPTNRGIIITTSVPRWYWIQHNNIKSLATKPKNEMPLLSCIWKILDQHYAIY